MKAVWLQKIWSYLCHLLPYHALLYSWSRSVVLTKHHALFPRSHQFLPVCVLGWIQRLWISVSCYSCTTARRQLRQTKFCSTEAMRTIETHVQSVYMIWNFQNGLNCFTKWQWQLQSCSAEIFLENILLFCLV